MTQSSVQILKLLQKRSANMMRKLALIMMLLIAVASAETVTMGNHTLAFNMDTPYIVQNNTINTIDGEIIFSDVRVNVGGTYMGYVQQNNKTYIVNIYEYYYLIIPIGDDYTLTSNMNLTDTVDFLKSLTVDKATAS
ncbi:MAG: hypothetical protein AB9879_04480 [Methanothrix sp.]